MDWTHYSFTPHHTGDVELHVSYTAAIGQTESDVAADLQQSTIIIDYDAHDHS